MFLFVGSKHQITLPGNLKFFKIPVFHRNPCFKEAFVQEFRPFQNPLPLQLGRDGQAEFQIIDIAEIRMQTVGSFDDGDPLGLDRDRVGQGKGAAGKGAVGKGAACLQGQEDFFTEVQLPSMATITVDCSFSSRSSSCCTHRKRFMGYLLLWEHYNGFSERTQAPEQSEKNQNFTAGNIPPRGLRNGERCCIMKDTDFYMRKKGASHESYP